MSRTSTRLGLFILFLACSYLIWEKEQVSLVPSIRVSRQREGRNPELKYPHVGELKGLKL